MLLRHIALVVLTGSVFAAEVQLGSETPVTRAVETEPASFRQWGAVVASNGRDFFAVWRDERESSGWLRMFLTRLDAMGRPVEPFGRRFREIGSHDSLLLVSNGMDYLVGW